MLVVVLGVALKTGSRSGIVGLVVTFLVYFIRIPLKRKVQFVITGACLMGIVLGFARDQVLERYKNLFESEVDMEEASQLDQDSERAVKTAAASANARQYVLKRSLEMTAAHPIFGLGIGAFQMGEAADAQSKGVRPTWHETHNLYTQVSSETGIPGLLIYLAAVIASQRLLSRILKLKGPTVNAPNLTVLRDSALHLQMSFVGAMAAAFFLAMAYNGLVFVLMALSAALYRSAQTEFAPEFARRAVRAPSPAMSPAQAGGEVMAPHPYRSNATRTAGSFRVR